MSSDPKFPPMPVVLSEASEPKRATLHPANDRALDAVSYTVHGHKIRVVNSADLNAVERAMEAVCLAERSRIVEWLRRESDRVMSRSCSAVADDIETGVHLADGGSR